MRKYSSIVSVFILLFIVIACKKEVSVKEGESAKNAVKEDLPSVALSFLNNYYPDVEMAKYEVKDALAFGKTYEVKLKNGAEVEFDDKGKWTEIKDVNGVDDGLLPENILIYKNKNYPDVKVIKVDMDKQDLKVELSNKIDLLFDEKGNFVRVD